MVLKERVRWSCSIHEAALAEMEINKHSSGHRQRGGNKRALNREHSENDYEGSDEPAESRSSSFPTSPRRRELHTTCFDIKQRLVLCYTLLTMPKIRASISTAGAPEGLKTRRLSELSSFDPA